MPMQMAQDRLKRPVFIKRSTYLAKFLSVLSLLVTGAAIPVHTQTTCSNAFGSYIGLLPDGGDRGFLTAGTERNTAELRRLRQLRKPARGSGLRWNRR